MDYCTVKEKADAWGISSRMVSVYCKENRIAGAFKMGNMWLIPQNAEKPIDMRINNGRKKMSEVISND